ncbi:MAG: CRISPR-associated endoribonuclease Cas6 [Nitrososphaerota archaeon]
MGEVINRVVRIVEMTFKVGETKIFNQEFPQDEFGEFTLMSGTPIVIRVPQNRLQEYGINPKHRYRYVYWRKEYTPKAFMKQLEENLIKKYNEYHETELKPFQIFEQLQFRKQVALPLRMRGEESTIIGTLWNFSFKPVNGIKRGILQFGLDAGFGEMNSLGFGFMNLNV